MFGKLRRTVAMNHDGIGMGLMICQNLVRLNGGTINAHSLGEDQGSTFSFSMKMKIDPVNDNCKRSIFQKQEMNSFKARSEFETRTIKTLRKPTEETKSPRREKPRVIKHRLSLNSHDSSTSNRSNSINIASCDEESLEFSFKTANEMKPLNRPPAIGNERIFLTNSLFARDCDGAEPKESLREKESK